MHQSLDGVGILCSGEFLMLSLSSGHERNSHCLSVAVLIYVEHLDGTCFCFLVCGVDGVSLLPQELSGAKERPCGLLPAKNGIPLVPYLRKVSVGLDCLRPEVAEQRLRCRTDAETLLESLHTSVCYPGNLRCKSFNMLCLFLKKTFRDQHRQTYILYACLFKTSVQICLDQLPDSISVGKVVQTSLYAGVVAEFSLAHYICIPLCEVFLAGSDIFY